MEPPIRWIYRRLKTDNSYILSVFRMQTNAYFSPCRKYRYALYRRWDDSKPTVLFIGLNPSTADETHNDPTITRCINFAKDWGYGGVWVANLFAYRATLPTDMMKYRSPLGKENDAWLKKLHDKCEIVIAAWGNDGKHKNRSTKVRKLIPKMHCLKINKTGEPAHPLYQPKTAQPIPYK